MGIVGTTHPFSSPRHRRYRRIGWRSRLFYLLLGAHPPPLQKQNTSWNHTPAAARSATGIQRDRWEVPPINRRQRGSNRLLHGWRRVRRHSGSGRLRYIQPHPREQLEVTPADAHTPHAGAQAPPHPHLVWLYVDLQTSQYPLGFLNPKDVNNPGTVAVAHEGDL